MIRTFFWAVGVLAIVLLLQTTLLNRIVLFGAKPDIVLIVFVLLATQYGSLVGQLAGFVVGIAIDVITVSPFGFHAFLFTVAGYVVGLGSGKVYLDPLIMPALLGLLSTLYLAFFGFVLNLIFRLGEPWSVYFNVGLIFQVGLNVVLAPLFFWIYGLVRERFQDKRRGFGA